MIEIEKARIDCAELSPDGTYGKFVVEPWSAALATRWATPCAVCCLARCPAWP